MADLGHNIVLYTTTWPLHKSGEKEVVSELKDEKGNYEIHTFPAKWNPFFPGLPHSPALVRAVLNHSREFDIVHSFSLWNPVASFSLRALRQCGVPYCLTPLGMLDPVVRRRNRWKKLAWSHFWERANIEGAALIHFTAGLEEERARSFWKLNGSIVVPQVVDLQHWQTLPDRSLIEADFPQTRGREVILFVGRINWVKNLDLLLKSLAKVRLKRPDSMLVCAGPDSEGTQSALEKQARELGIRDHVLFTGMLRGERLKSAYARADVLALVSRKENFGHAAAEALACGIPVVLSREVGLAADWPASESVRRVDANPEAIASALIQVLERNDVSGLPDREARSLAFKFLGAFPGARIADAYRSVVSAR